MTSLQEYVTQQFPHHDIDMLEPRDSSDLELTDNTVVSFVVGSRAGLDLLSSFRQSVPNSRVAAVTVKPTDPSVVPTGDEDGDGVVDLPVRRVAAYGVIGFVAVGVLGALIAAITTDSATSIAIAAVFAGIIGAIVGAIVGGSRLAGQRATSQPRAPGRDITVVAAFLDDDASAASLARSVGPAANYEVRIVDHDGGWRSPGTA
ncbi:MAG TPA: hypothetical protein VHQ23_16485 [Ilumatobacteraceae bacterium]|nr:hypothetical protein [Ilumatobacteraceae bacterium]